MKKIYTLVGCALTAGMVVAQSPFTVNGQYNFAATSKHAPNAITFTDMRDAASLYQDRVLYYTEDFDAGFNGWVAATQNGPVDFEITSNKWKGTNNSNIEKFKKKPIINIKKKFFKIKWLAMMKKPISSFHFLMGSKRINTYL